MAGALTTFGKDLFLSYFRGSTLVPPANVHYALFTSNPGIAGSTAGEVSTSSTGYSRKAIATSTAQFTAPTGTTGNGRVIDNAARQSIGTLTATWGTITHWGLMDQASGGNMLVYGDLNGGVGYTPTVGTEVAVDIGALDLILAES